MKKILFYLVTPVLFGSCDNSKWQTIYGKGINDEPKSVDNVIYFENENSGVVGGYTLVEDSNAHNDVKLSQVPTLFLTSDGGKNWREIKFNSTLKQSVRNAYLHKDTLICELDSLILFSTDKGLSFNSYVDSLKRITLIKNYLKENKSLIENDSFHHKGTNYYIKELFQNDHASVIVCKGPEVMTDYYFVSFDKGTSWNFLQKDFGDNRQRFLLDDKFLFSYDFPFGLQKLKLK
jgi:hypothetical protein